jgi:hypothetical protein
MKIKDAYYAVFDILNNYWEDMKVDDLGNMLSDMSPYTFVSDDDVSADPAIYEQWEDLWNNIVGYGQAATNSQVLAVANAMLGYYANSLGYDLGGARKVLAAVFDVLPEDIAIAI